MDGLIWYVTDDLTTIFGLDYENDFGSRLSRGSHYSSCFAKPFALQLVVYRSLARHPASQWHPAGLDIRRDDMKIFH